MEKLATRKLRIGAKTAMQIAERLYSKGFISYPRTETNIFPDGIDLVHLVRVQTGDNRWAGMLHSSWLVCTAWFRHAMNEGFDVAYGFFVDVIIACTHALSPSAPA